MAKLSEILALVMEKKGRLFTTEELVSLGYSKAEVSRILRQLGKDKIIYRISRGVYTKDPPESGDMLAVAQKIFKGYIGFASACYAYGWLEYFPFEVHIVTKSKSSSKQIGKFLVQAVALKEKAVGSEFFSGHIVSTKGKTLFDIFYKPEMAGGLKEVMKIVYKSDAGLDDWKSFLYYSKKFGSSSFRQRAGYLLFMLKSATGKKIPLKLENFKQKKMPVVRLGSGKAKAFSKEWNIVDCIGKEAFGWYDGN